jgi:hypothetical protein
MSSHIPVSAIGQWPGTMHVPSSRMRMPSAVKITVQPASQMVPIDSSEQSLSAGTMI